MNYTLISSPAIAACNKRPLLQDVSLASHALELTKEEACLARVIDSNFQCYSDYEYYKEIKSIYAKCVARYRSVGPTTKFTRLDIKSDHMYTPEVIFEGTLLIFFGTDSCEAYKNYVLYQSLPILGAQ